MKSAGYDIALLLNERFLNQLSGVLFYSGFLTLNGSVDLYAGKMMLEHQVMDYETALTEGLEGNVPEELQRFLKIDFRFKLTQEPMVSFVQTFEASEQSVRIALGMRLYFWLWEGLELKFDASCRLLMPITVDTNLKMEVDLAAALVEEMTIKYGGGVKPEMVEKLDRIVEAALGMYFANHRICQKIELPCISKVVKDIKDYIQPDQKEGKDLGIIPVHLDAIRIVSDKVMVLGINLMDYHGGNPEALHVFARNCSMAIAISEIAIDKVFHYVWTHSQFTKTIGSKADLSLVKHKNALSVSKSGALEVEQIDKFFNKATEVVDFLGDAMARILTANIIETSLDYHNIDFYYDVGLTLKNEPKFDLRGGNVVYIYNMAFGAYFRLSCDLTYSFEVKADTSWFIPDSWTPWEDDVTLYSKTKSITVFDQHIRIDNLELQYAKGELRWDEAKQSLIIKIIEIKPYWNLDKLGSPLYKSPPRLINWITDAMEKQLVKRIPEFTVSPKLQFDLPYIPWDMKTKIKGLEVTNSEAIVVADLGFDQLKNDTNPVPKYVVNINNAEIHKIGCDAITDTYEVHQRSYHLLNDALNKGYDGCKKCLPVFHKK